jgi:hypothetical protein
MNTDETQIKPEDRDQRTEDGKQTAIQTPGF